MRKAKKLMKRTNRQIIDNIKAELGGMVNEFGWNEKLISAALNKRYNPSKIVQAIEEYTKERA